MLACAPRADSPFDVATSRTFDSEIARRIATSIVLIPIALGSVLAGGLLFIVLISVGTALVIFEWTRMTAPTAGRGAVIALLGIVLGAIAGFVFSGAVTGLSVLAAGIILIVVIAPRLGLDRSWSAAGLCYAGLASLCLLMLRGSAEFGLETIVWLFLLVWLADIAALAVGRTVGGPRLAPRISPAKTWSGALASVAAAMMVGLAAAFIVGHTSKIALVAISGGVGIAAILGDLVESWIKRRFGAKDSGALIPGHGGMMDRVDSLIFAAVAAWAFGSVRAGLESPAGGVFVW